MGEKIALVDHLAFIEGDLHDLPVDWRWHQNGVVGLDLSDALEHDRKVGALDRRHRDHDRRRAVRLRLLPRRRRGLAGRGPDPVVQLMGKPTGGGNPPVRRLGRIDAVGGGRPARQHGHPREPGEPHDRKPFLNPARRAAAELSFGTRAEPGAAADRAEPPACRRFQCAGSRGEQFANTTIRWARDAINQI